MFRPPSGCSPALCFASLEALNPPRNGAARDFEQINAFHSWCDHQSSSFERSANEAFLRARSITAMKNTIYNSYREYTRWKACFLGTFVLVLMLRTECSLLARKPAHSSRLLPPDVLMNRFVAGHALDGLTELTHGDFLLCKRNANPSSVRGRAVTI